MKALLTTSVMVIIMIGGWLAFSFYTDKSSEELVDYMNAVYEDSYLEEWDGAADACNDFLDKWADSSRIYGLYMESACVHDIELSAKRCRAYVNARDRELALGESASILAHLKLMNESDRISLINVL